MKVSAIDFGKEIVELTESFTGREWVFKEIDNWLRHRDEQFFILIGEPGVGKSAIIAELINRRKAQNDIAAYHFCVAGKISTIEPNNVLFSLAAQLSKYLPNYTKVLIDNIKPLHLSINVEIDIQTTISSNVLAVWIENLHTKYPKESLEIILRRTLSVLPNPDQKTILILIDSLDEAVTYNGEDNLVRLFSNIKGDLPSWVRFIVTSRPDERRVLSLFKTLKPYHYYLDELSTQSLEDIHTYVDERVKTTGIQLQLQKYQVDPATLVPQITELSKGNFLYTKVLLNDIESSGQPLDAENLAKLPKSLNEFYHNFLTRRVESEWEGKYQLIFKILTVTKAPITEEELANIVIEDLTETELGQRLKIVQQFLDVVEDYWGNKTYTLFHKSLRDYLVARQTSGIFYCSPKDGHQQIVEHYWQYQEDPRSWSECDRYALQFLASHLVELAVLEKPPVKGRKYIEKLHELLATEVDGRSAWFEAKNRIGDTVGFVADVKLAWKQIGEQEFQQKPEIAISLQCRYALIISSINSLSGNIPTSLVMKLMKIDSVKGLSYVRQLILNRHEQSLQILNTLVLDLDEPKLQQQLLEVAQAISDKNYRIQVQSALAKYLSEEKLREVFEAAQVIQNEKDRAYAINMLIPYLPSDQQIKILEATQAIGDEYYRAKVFGTLAKYLSQDLLPLILKIIGEIKSADYRSDALIEAVLYLPEKLLPEVLKIILEISRDDEEYSQTRALCGLAAVSNLTVDIIGKIQKAAEIFETKNYRTQVRSALAPYLPLDQLYKILEEVEKIEDEYYRSQILSALASRLPSDQLHKILEQLQMIEDEDNRSLVLSSLVSYLPLDLQYKILEEVQTIEDEYNRFLILSKLASAPNLNTELAEKIQKQAEAFQDKDYRIQLLSELASYLSEDQVYKVIQQAQEIPDKYDRYLTLSSLASYFPLDQLYKLLEEVEKIQYEYISFMLLSKLATIPNLTKELQEKIQKQAEVFQNQDYRIKVLSLMAQYLSEEMRLLVLETAREIQNEEDQAEILSALFPYLPSEQQAEILKTVLEFENQENQIQVFSTLNPYLPSEQLHEILEKVQAIPDEYYRCLASSTLVTYLSLNQSYNLLEQIQAFDNEENQTLVLSQLASAPNLPTDLREKIQKQAEAFQDKHNRIQILSLLAPYLQPKEQHKIFEEVQAIEEEYYRSLALSRLIPSLPSNQLQDVLKVTQEIQNEFNRRDILKVLAPELAKLPHDELYCLWSSTLPILANRSREHLLTDIRELIPIIFSLGKHEAIVKIYDAIRKIEQQWP
jgi:NACHT domain